MFAGDGAHLQPSSEVIFFPKQLYHQILLLSSVPLSLTHPLHKYCLCALRNHLFVAKESNLESDTPPSISAAKWFTCVLIAAKKNYLLVLAVLWWPLFMELRWNNRFSFPQKAGHHSFAVFFSDARSGRGMSLLLLPPSPQRKNWLLLFPKHFYLLLNHGRI